MDRHKVRPRANVRNRPAKPPVLIQLQPALKDNLLPILHNPAPEPASPVPRLHPKTKNHQLLHNPLDPLLLQKLLLNVKEVIIRLLVFGVDYGDDL